MDHDDACWATITREAALAIGTWLEAAPGLLKRQIYTLTLADLECLAIAAISQAEVTRARLLKEERERKPPEDISLLA